VEQEDDGTGLVPVELDEAQLKERHDDLVSWNVKLYQLEDKKRDAVKKINAELKLAKEKAKQLTRECDTKIAYVDPQQALNFSSARAGSNDSHVAAS
jgi:hypothetical protein